MVAVGDHVLARQRAAAADVLITIEVEVAAANARHARPQHRNQHRIAGPFAQERAHRPDLILLDVDQEHVRAAFLRL
jgi:hypothetical protein